MNKQREIIVYKVKPQQEEIYLNIFEQIGALGSFVEADKNNKNVLVKALFKIGKKPSAIQNMLKEKLKIFGLTCNTNNIRIKTYFLKKNRQKKKEIKVGGYIIGDSSYRKSVPQNTILLKIDDINAFGTGFHETTQMCLRLLSKAVKPGMKVLDIGSGTGILAIAAAKLGAKSVVSIEHDPVAAAVANKNIKINQVETQVKILNKNIYEYKKKGTYDLVVANVTAEILEHLFPTIGRFFNKNCFFIMSGIHKKFCKNIEKLIKLYPWQVEKVLKKGDWVATMVFCQRCLPRADR